MTKIEQDLKDSWKLCPLIIAHLTKEVGLLRVCIGQTTDIDIKSYPLKVIDKLTTMLTTLWKVINIDKDFYVANVVIRSITDNVALLFLIYYKDEGEIRVLRHYLFLLDGIRSRLANIIIPIKNDGITEEEYQKLIKQQEDFKSTLNGCKKYIIECITSLKIYNTNKLGIDMLMKSQKGEELYNWKFKTLNITPSQINKGKNTYNWKSMYSEIKLPEEFFSSFLSDYVHGLSMSNITIAPDKQNMGALVYITKVLMERIELFIHKYYAIELKDIQKNTEQLCLISVH